MHDKKAAMTNRMNFGVSPTKTISYRRDINQICKGLNQYLNKAGYNAPDKREPVRSLIVAKLLEYTLRDNSEDPHGYCPICHKWHTFPDVEMPCPSQPNTHPKISLKMWNPKNDQNSIMAGMKMMDKLFPNLAAVSGTINVEGTITTVSAELIKVIIEYVPAEKREECFQRVDSMLANLQQTGVEG